MKIPFTKMHGIGNDFVVIDATYHQYELTPKLIQKLSDRHFGIGFDQLLVIAPPSTPAIDFDYLIYNADGSQSSQCGNGARCVAKFILEKKLAKKNPIILGTATGTIEVHSVSKGQFKVNMGIPIFDNDALLHSLTVNQQTIPMGLVSMGNPHAVIQVEDINAAPVTTLAPLIQQHPYFPHSVNVGFMQILNKHTIKLRVYERGAGETLACGSGACAAVAIGYSQGLLAEEVQVKLPGGELAIEWHGTGTVVWMQGSSETVFEGSW